MSMRSIPPLCHRGEGGYAALMSVILISGILLLVVTVASYRGYFGRSSVLFFELKERSAALAETCIDQAIAELARSNEYFGNETVRIGAHVCTIGIISRSGTTTTILSRASFGDAFTNLRVFVDSGTLVVVSWEEIPASF
jgi:Tfp pilus assembly protein PilE